MFVLSDSDDCRRIQEIPQGFVVDLHVRDAQEEFAFGVLREIAQCTAAGGTPRTGRLTCSMYWKISETERGINPGLPESPACTKGRTISACAGHTFRSESCPEDAHQRESLARGGLPVGENDCVESFHGVPAVCQTSASSAGLHAGEQLLTVPGSAPHGDKHRCFVSP